MYLLYTYICVCLYIIYVAGVIIFTTEDRSQQEKNNRVMRKIVLSMQGLEGIRVAHECRTIKKHNSCPRE